MAYDPQTGRPIYLQASVGASPQTFTQWQSWNANGSLGALTTADQFNSSNNQTCGYTYDDLSRVQAVNCGNMASSWNANGGSGIYHLCGRADGDGWSASVGLDSTWCTLQYGPYTTQLTSAGYYTAQWILMVDNNTADDYAVAYVDVTAWNGSTLVGLANTYITRQQFNYPSTYQTFTLPFYLDSAHAGWQIQFRVYWLGVSYVKEKSLDYDTEAVWSQTFGYDAFGNLAKSGSVSFAAGYLKSDGTTNNRIQSLPGFTPTYDLNGNTLSDSQHTYSWDAEGHAITIDSIGLTYDALGRMAEQQSGSSYTEILYGPTGKLGLMNGQSVIKALIPLPGATAVYTSGPTLSYFRHPDWLGSSRFASTPSRTMYYSGAYAPFGETYSETNPNDHSFTGQNQDTASGQTTGLYDFMFREYAQYGRWISPDPAGGAAVDITNPQTWNRYAYVVNNPLGLIDPLGLQCDNNCQAARLNNVNLEFSRLVGGCSIEGMPVPCWVRDSIGSDALANCPQCQPGQMVGNDNVIYSVAVDFFRKDCNGPVSGGVAGAFGNCTTTFVGTGIIPVSTLLNIWYPPWATPGIPNLTVQAANNGPSITPVVQRDNGKSIPNVPGEWGFCSKYRDGSGAGSALYNICMNFPNFPSQKWAGCVRGNLLNQYVPNGNPLQLTWYLFVDHPVDFLTCPIN